ncbi:hypothetical protein CLV58_109191 [Spirosoma oryzae]|uniref:Uncharacterized protein n=1 Tax=Spirosoma oryzae TaxID=1469603 RepID=A0A2T0SYI5_9BACT|nr:hypothetical protein [Spirosoma oryzae]PRY38464.1 hypothetical protein CLV58_109191 [Spirosoma oryzae]
MSQAHGDLIVKVMKRINGLQSPRNYTINGHSANPAIWSDEELYFLVDTVFPNGDTSKVDTCLVKEACCKLNRTFKACEHWAYQIKKEGWLQDVTGVTDKRYALEKAARKKNTMDFTIEFFTRAECEKVGLYTPEKHTFVTYQIAA